MHKHGSEELQQCWKAVYNNDLETANKFREQIGKKPYDEPEDAVRGLVWKVCWYSNFDIRLIKRVVRRSAFEHSAHYTRDTLAQARQDAREEIEEPYHGL